MTYINILVTTVFHIFHKIILRFLRKKNRANHEIMPSLHHKCLCALVVLLSCRLSWSAIANFKPQKALLKITELM